jgi:hypothetical protein
MFDQFANFTPLDTSWHFELDHPMAWPTWPRCPCHRAKFSGQLGTAVQTALKTDFRAFQGCVWSLEFSIRVLRHSQTATSLSCCRQMSPRWASRQWHETERETTACFPTSTCTLWKPYRVFSLTGRLHFRLGWVRGELLNSKCQVWQW